MTNEGILKISSADITQVKGYFPSWITQLTLLWVYLRHKMDTCLLKDKENMELNGDFQLIILR